MHFKSRILVVDDHPIFRKGLRQLIDEEPDMMVCGEAEDVNAARRAVRSLSPDMVIVDISLKDKSGLELLRHIQSTYPSLPTLVISMHDEQLYAERALRAGARGYIMKVEMTENVTQAIRQVLQGRIYASSDIVARLMAGPNTGESDVSVVDALSDRELEVFRLIGKGYGRQEIAGMLGVSVKTVGSYREMIKKKLSVKTAPELMKTAIEWVRSSEAG